MLQPTPPASHLLRYAGAPSASRASVAAFNRRQVEAPRDGRPWSTYYGPVVRATKEFITEGPTSRAYERCLAKADPKRVDNYRMVGQGLRTICEAYALVAVGKSRRITIPASHGGLLTRISFDLCAGSSDGNEYRFFLHFAARELNPAQLDVLKDLLVCIPQPELLPPKVVVGFPRGGGHQVMSTDELSALRANRRIEALVAAYELDWNAA